MTRPLGMASMHSVEPKCLPSGKLSPESTVGSHVSADLPLQLLVIGLTCVTGILDAVTYLDFGHVFAANMTGNFVLLGLSFLRADDLSVQASLVAVAGFLLGTAGGSRVTGWLESHQQRCIVTSLSTGVGLLLLALLANTYRPVLGEYPALTLLACAMGMINATVSEVGIPGLTTTIVITSTLTNLVSGTQLPNGDGRKRVRQVSSLAAITVGAVLGAALLLRFGVVAAIGAAMTIGLAGTAAYAVAVLRKSAVLRGSSATPWSAPH